MAAIVPAAVDLDGDFNLPGWDPALVTGMEPVVRGPTYPSVAPRIRFDHILLDGFDPATVRAAADSVRILPLGVSDHCAVVAEVDLAQ